MLIAGLGIDVYAVREGAIFRDNKDKFNTFANQVFTINICSTLIAYLLLFVCLMAFSKLHTYLICILIFSLQILFTTLGTEWVYQIYEDYAYITLRGIAFQIISIVLLFIFVRKPSDYINYAWITVFSVAGSNLLNFIHARKYFQLELVKRFDWKVKLKPILIIFGVNIASMIYVNSDITLLGIIKNSYVVGLYSVSSKIYQIVKTLIAAVLIVTVPRLAMLIGKKKYKEYQKLLSKLTNTLVLLVLPASVGLFMLSKEVILIISGKNYLQATKSLRILCFAYIFSILSWILTECVLIPAKREKKVLLSTSISAALNIFLNIIFIPYWNENAAALSTVVAEISMLIINYYYAKDLVRGIYFSKEFIKNIIMSCIGCLGIILVCYLCSIGLKSGLIKTILSIILSVIIYFAILIALDNKIIISVLNNFVQKINLKK